MWVGSGIGPVLGRKGRDGKKIYRENLVISVC